MKIVALGDSFTQGYLVEEKSYTRFLQKAGFEIKNLGVNGSTTEEMLNRYKRYQKLKEKEDLLIIFGGTNDFMNGKSLEFVEDNLKSILNISQARKTMLISPPYIEEEKIFSFYEGVNRKIKALEEKVHGADYYIRASQIDGHYLDGIHLASDFHQNLAREIEKILGEEIDRNSK